MNKKSLKRGNESRRIRESGESTLENIDEREESDFTNDMNKKQGKNKKKKVKKKDRKQDEIDKTLIQLEKNNKEKMLDGDLIELLEEVEKENKDFKKNVFFCNFHELNKNLGIFDNSNNHNKTNQNYVGLKDDEMGTSYGFINKYTERAEGLRKSIK